MSLWVGANYHPHDWSIERVRTDIRLMREAGFTRVRLGHLCWDSYEPADGVYTFDWFDEVMDLFADAGIGVILDLSTHPAPTWVHVLCPGCNIVSASGAVQAPLRRYMEDVDDPEYQHYAYRFVSELISRYKDHPALKGFGLCNELGDGYPSYSEYARKRYIAWLERKYGDIEKLNQAWNTRRWSRKMQSFDQIPMQQNEISCGAPEAWLDMRRFFGEGVARHIVNLSRIVEKLAPGVPYSSNHWSERPGFGFDYIPEADQLSKYASGMGFYPGLKPGNREGLLGTLTTHEQRLAETGTPMWFLEFVTGGHGEYEGPEGLIRMYAMLGLIYRTQMVLGWTWRSMLGGEEQYLYGLLDHDGEPSRKYYEFKKLAADFKILENFSFPYLPSPKIAIAYSWESSVVMEYEKQHYRTEYSRQVMQAFAPFYDRSLDVNFVDLRKLKNQYTLIVVPGQALMDRKSAETLREFVRTGGMVIMTGYSAMVDETSTVFECRHPGLLADVFGIRAAGYHVIDPEETLHFRYCGAEASEPAAFDGSGIRYFEQVTPVEAKTLVAASDAHGRNLGSAVTLHRYGEGAAVYFAPEANEKLLGQLYDRLQPAFGLPEPLYFAKDVIGRYLSDSELFLVNTSSEAVNVSLPSGVWQGKLTGENSTGSILLAPFDAELLVTQKN